MIWFSADTHFHSDDTLKREGRPFKNHKEFDNFVIDLWNNEVSKDDIIYHLGDFCNYNDFVKDNWENGLKLVSNIKCKVILIIGNNEQRIIDEKFAGNFNKFRDFCISIGFEDVCKSQMLVYDKKEFYLNHFPSKHLDGYINLFGHTHKATGLYKPFGLCVCCDLNYFKLFSLLDILRLLKEKEIFWDNDIDCNCQ